MYKTTLYKNEAREALQKGINKLADAVKVTLGPRGRTVVYCRANQTPVSTKDGVTVAREVALQDLAEDAGAQIIYQAANKTAQDAGDATTTACVLAQVLINEGIKAINSGENPVSIKAGIEKAVKAVVEDIKRQAKQIEIGTDDGQRTTVDQNTVFQVATIAANGDEAIGRFIAEAVDKIGRDGIISIGDTLGMDTSIDIVKGLRINKGMSSWHFITNPGKKTAELDNPYILIYEKKVSSANDLFAPGGILQTIKEQGRSVLILAEEIEGEALASLILSKHKAGLKVCPVKLPGIGDQRRELLQDIAVLTGATITGPERNIKLKQVTLAHLGSVDKASINADGTILFGSATRTDAVNARVDELRVQLMELGGEVVNSDDRKEYERNAIKERIAKLTGGIAVIHVGGSTEIEIRERRDRVDDAIRATQSALQEGIVAGGGICLLQSIPCLKRIAALDEGERKGINIVRMALQAPLMQIVDNGGESGEYVLAMVRTKDGGKVKEDNYGYNARTGEYVDMLNAGIIDAAKVVRCAIENAASVAIVVLTSECLMVEDPQV